MKILLLGDASNYHVFLAHGLKALGHDVTVASDGCTWMDTYRDVDLSRSSGKLSGALLYTRMQTVLADAIRGYDVVQLSSPGFVELTPRYLRTLFDKIRRNNGAVYLTALGTDAAFVRNLAGKNPVLEYSEWQYGQGLTSWARSDEGKLERWLAPELQGYTDYLYGHIDGVVSALYEYHKVVETEYPGVPLCYGGIPIVTDELAAPAVRPGGDTVSILYAVHKWRVREKGADKLLALLQRLVREHGDRVSIVAPPNVPYREFLRLLPQCDMVCDQLYSYTPSVTPLLSMASGLVPITGGEDEFYGFIGENRLRPIFNPDPRDIEDTYRRLETLVLAPDKLRGMSAQAAEFVLRHHDPVKVASRFVGFWEKR